jgi:ribosomal protein L11 methyltransferase
MKSKSLWRISVTTTREAEDAVTELLGSTPGRPVSSHFNVETGVSTVTVYGRRKLISSQDAREKIRTGLERIKNCGLKIGSGKITVAKVRREDWAESWKRHFKPIEIKLKNRRGELREPIGLARKSGRRGNGTRITRPSERNKSLLIKPSWSKRKPRKNQAVVVLDPGLSFGTGRHPTTMFCLKEIVRRSTGRARAPQRAGTDGSESCPHPKQSFLDLGAGSGILAIAAAKLGYQPVRAIDFDPEAVRVARANARANRVHNKLRIVRGDVARLPFRTRRRYDFVCANLISNLLIAERRRIAAQLNHRGTLALAGILKREFTRVRRAFEELCLKLVSSECQGEWRSGSFCFVREK